MYISGKDLRSMRQHAGLTTVQMAELAGVKTRKTYENWEKDIGSPNVNQFIALCLGCKQDTAQVIRLAETRNDHGSQLDFSKSNKP